MQNMEKYFGFRVRVSDFLEPEDYSVIRDQVSDLLARGKESETQYRVYLHQLVLDARESQFGIGGGLAGRINSVRLCFSINAKQRRTGDIKFMNYRFEKELHEEVVHQYFSNQILYTLTPKYFEDRGYFQNTLITLVRIGMRDDHKKIKIRVSVEPSPFLLERLARKEKADVETNLDIDFRKAREFNRQTRIFLTPPEQSMTPDKKPDNPSRISIVAQNIGAVVTDPNAPTNVNFAENPIVRDHLLHELRLTSKSLRDDPPPGLVAKDLEVIDAVIIEAPTDKTALDKLISVGKWLGTRAEKLGMTLLAEYLKQQAGL